MSVVPPQAEQTWATSVPRLLVELPPWRGVFFDNLHELIFPPHRPQLELRSDPAPFWPDVFVKHEFPWSAVIKSGACHLVVLILLMEISHFLTLPPRATPSPVFDRSHVLYYSRTEYLPRIDTRTSPPNRPRKADPEFARQPILSLPRETDNRSQTIVTPPNVKLKNDVPLPNIASWSDARQKPRLAIPDVPVSPATEIARIAPRAPNVVVTAPPDVRVSRSSRGFNAPQASVIAPPSNAESAPTRSLRDLNIGRSAVINPAPQLAVSEQRAISEGRSSALSVAPQIVPPPPSPSAGGSSGGPGRVVALNLHPALAAPDPPPGNRRGAFAATAEGNSGASGTPGSASGGTTGTETGGNKKETADLPSGLYVGSAAESSPVVGDPASRATSPIDRNVIASVHQPRVTSAPRTMQPEDPAKLSAAERAVFGNRKFYSLLLNVPNLNSASGSWIIRFAELKRDADSPRDHAAVDPADALTQPSATRKVDPGYPTQLMRQNVAGTVILYAIIHADGTVGDVRILRSVNDRLDQLAAEALLQWRFEPATKNGAPVDIEATFQVPFKPAKFRDNF